MVVLLIAMESVVCVAAWSEARDKRREQSRGKRAEVSTRAPGITEDVARGDSDCYAFGDVLRMADPRSAPLPQNSLQVHP